MKLGERIKQARTNKGWSQEILASMVHVTRQAVAKWETDENEPSIEMIKTLASVLGVSVMYLLDEVEEVEEKKEPQQSENTILTNTISEKDKQEIADSVAEKVKPALGVCDYCHKVITDPDDYHHKEFHSSHGGTRTRTLCDSCFQNKIKADKVAKDTSIVKKRRRAYVWGVIIALVYLAISLPISISLKGSNQVIGIIISIIGCVLMFTFIGCIFLNNNFVGEIWIEIMSWGFVKMPGVIFTLDLDGIFFLLTVKLFLWILGIIIALFMFSLATSIGMIVSVFVYPSAIKKSYDFVE